MTGNLLGASASGLIGDFLGWRGVLAVLGVARRDRRDRGRRRLSRRGADAAAEDQPRRAQDTATARSSPIRTRASAIRPCSSRAAACSDCFPSSPRSCSSSARPRLSIAGIVIAGFAVGGLFYTDDGVAVAAAARRQGHDDLGRDAGRPAARRRSRLGSGWKIQVLILLSDGLGLLHASTAACRCSPANCRWKRAPPRCRCIRSSSSWARPSARSPTASASAACRQDCRPCSTAAAVMVALGFACAQLLRQPAPADADSAAGRQALAPPAIGRDALVGHPHALRQSAGLPEHVDRDAAARIPVAADAQPFRLDLGRRSACRSSPCNPRGRRRDCGSSRR